MENMEKKPSESFLPDAKNVEAMEKISGSGWENPVAEIKFLTGRNCEKFTDLEEAKKHADKWKDKSISVYKNGMYHSTIHKVNGVWYENGSI